MKKGFISLKNLLRRKVNVNSTYTVKHYENRNLFVYSEENLRT